MKKSRWGKKSGRIFGAVVGIVLCVIIIVLIASGLMAEYIRRLYAELTLPEAQDNPAYMGHLIIGSVGINVPCVKVEISDRTLTQRLVDKSNCAAMMWHSKLVPIGDITGTWLIADHADQGFRRIRDCVPGDIAVFKSKDGTETEYVVTASFEGYRYNGELNCDDESIMEDNHGGITLYTCLDSTGIPVHIVFLQPANQ